MFTGHGLLTNNQDKCIKDWDSTSTDLHWLFLMTPEILFTVIFYPQAHNFQKHFLKLSTTIPQMAFYTN